MRYLFCVLFLFLNNTEKIKAIKMDFLDEIDLLSWYEEGDGLSNCILPIVSATSSLKPNKDISYFPENANEGSFHNAWIEGKSDYGIGESIEFTYLNTKYENQSFTINEVVILNGYYKSEKLWKTNSRVKQFVLYYNNEETAILELLDIRNPQRFKIPNISIEYNKTTKIRFKILEVYKGSKYKDSAITSFKFNGTGCM